MDIVLILLRKLAVHGLTARTNARFARLCQKSRVAYDHAFSDSGAILRRVKIAKLGSIPNRVLAGSEIEIGFLFTSPICLALHCAEIAVRKTDRLVGCAQVVLHSVLIRAWPPFRLTFSAAFHRYQMVHGDLFPRNFASGRESEFVCQHQHGPKQKSA